MAEKKKMGRPTEAPRTYRVEVRLSKEEFEMLEECVALSGTTKTNVIARGIARVFYHLKK